jgi:2-iminobutanoate/2-iminopropanoate deaminase
MHKINDLSNVPKAVGPYSIATKVNLSEGDLIFFSGQIAIDPVSGTLSGDIKAQTEAVLNNIHNALLGVKATFANVVKSTIFLTDLENFSLVNELYSQYFGEHKPARSTIGVVALPLGALVEIEIIAQV